MHFVRYDRTREDGDLSRQRASLFRNWKRQLAMLDHSAPGERYAVGRWSFARVREIRLDGIPLRRVGSVRIAAKVRSRCYQNPGPRDSSGCCDLMGRPHSASARGKAEQSEILQVPAALGSPGACGTTRSQRADGQGVHHAPQTP